MSILGGQTLRRTMISGVAIVGLVAFFFLGPRTTHHSEATKTYATAEGQQAVLTLSDGSRVVLSPRTTLRLIDFGPRARTVDIDGEAYFDVATDEIPFVVRSGDVTTRVLGTSFLVRHLVRGTHIHVAVETGKVRITTRSAGVTLTAGQVGDVQDSTIRTSMTEDVPRNVEWMSGQFVFRHTPLATVLQTVSRWYGYQFRYTDHTLAQRNVTIGISTQSSMEALAELERVLVVNLTVVGDTVTLSPQLKHPAGGSSRMRTYDVWTPTREVGR